VQAQPANNAAMAAIQAQITGGPFGPQGQVIPQAGQMPQGMQIPGQPFPVQQQPQQQFPGQPGMGYPTTAATQPGRGQGTPNAAAQMIMNQLTQPRPMPGGVPGAPGLTIGGGIAGVASTLESDSIKVFNERQKYNEWEFVYEIKNDKRPQAGRTPGAPTNQPGGPLQPTPTGNPNPNPNPIPNPSTINPGGSNQLPGQPQGFPPPTRR